MRVTLAQIDCLLSDVDGNLRRVREVVAEAKAEGADLVVFPELSLAGYALGEFNDEVAIEAWDERIVSLAAEAGEMAVVVGFCEEGRGPHTYNSAAYLEGGSLLHLHRKLYLPTYRIYEERKHYSPGQSMRAFDTRLGRMTMLICNDAWQPFLPFIAVQDGAQVLLIPSNSGLYPHPELLDTKEYWRDITRFYARMLQSYVVFVNRVGKQESLIFFGLLPRRRSLGAGRGGRTRARRGPDHRGYRLGQRPAAPPRGAPGEGGSSRALEQGARPSCRRRR